MPRTSHLLALYALLIVLASACSPRETKPRTVKATLNLYEFVNPTLEKQLDQVADSCFFDDPDNLVLTIFPNRTLYAEMPDIDPEQGAPCNALLETYHCYYGYESDSSFFSRITSCVKIGKRICYLEDTVPDFLRSTGQRITEQHTFTTEETCLCADERRYILLGSDGLVQRVYPVSSLVPDGLIDTILFIVPDRPPQFPDGNDALSRWISLHAQWPDSLPQIIATFTVELDGSVSDIQAPPSVKDPSERAFIESLRPLLPSLPRWSPGKIYGKTVRSNILIRLKRP
ncbi:MAG: hypothetical protein J5711_03205 [Bacteroidales bacterium]|nr:hypothetical protein [Bacteroidales bacterium]